MKDRTIRFGLVGLFLLVSCTFFYWSLGGNIEFLSDPSQSKILELTISLVSTPIIGFVISTMAISLTRIFILSNKMEFQKPNFVYEQEYLGLIFAKSKEKIELSGVKSTDTGFKIDDIKRLYIFHTVLFLKVPNSEAISFSSRRIDIYTTNVSLIFSVLLALLLSLILVIHNNIIFQCEFSLNKLFFVLIFLCYICLATCHAKKNLEEANDFEKTYLLEQRNSAQH